MPEVSVKSLAFIGSRLIALYFAFVALAEFVNMSGMIFVSFHENRQNAATVYTLAAILVASRLLVACVLWFGADLIARKIVGRNTETSTTNGASGDVLQKALFAAAGLVVVVWSAPELVAAVYKYANLDEFRSKGVEGFRIRAEIIANVLKVLLGMILLLGAAGIRHALARIVRKETQ